MKLLKSVLSFIIVSCLASCGGGGGGSSTTSTPTVPSSIPSGAKISINPEIELTSELSVGSPATAIYSNSDGTNFSVNSGENILLTMETSGSTITVSFELATKEKIEVITSDFTDLGEDGYYDEFTGEIKVNGKKNMTIRGYFTGTKKPRNLAVTSPVDINRAPTEEEFKKYLVGQVLYHEETYPEPGEDSGYFVLNADGTATGYESKDDTDIDDDLATWMYNFNNGDPQLTLRWDEPDSDDYDLVIVDFDFTTFYEGTYQDIYEEENGKQVTNANDRGNWKILKSVPSGYVPER